MPAAPNDGDEVWVHYKGTSVANRPTLVGNTGQKMETPDGSGVITAAAGTITLPNVVAYDGAFKWDNTDSTWYEIE